MGRAEVQPSVNVLMRADPIVHYTIAFTVTGHEKGDQDRDDGDHDQQLDQRETTPM